MPHISPELAEEFRFVRDMANKSSGLEHEYYLGQQVGFGKALALVSGVTWVDADLALNRAANSLSAEI